MCNSCLSSKLLEPMVNNSSMQRITASMDHMSEKRGGMHQRTWAEREPLHEMHIKAKAEYDSHFAFHLVWALSLYNLQGPGRVSLPHRAALEDEACAASNLKGIGSPP
jgi:hypothetical protein